MVKEKYIPVLSQILELLDTACQASLELLGVYCNGKLDTAQQLLQDLRSVTSTVDVVCQPFLAQLEHSYAPEMLENVADTIEEIEKAISTNIPGRAAEKIEFQLFPFLRQLRETFYFWGMIYPARENMSRYYQEEFAEHYRNPYLREGEPARYQVSVVIVAYNHLDLTKQCVESVLKHTDLKALNAELVLVDHGSTDGTLEYFEKLGTGRVIHYKRNMRGSMFCMLPQLCDSEYYVHVANDTIVTKDWLDILLQCARSDSKILLAAPATCNISNLQAVNVPTSDCDALVRLAETRNHSDARLWNDRVRMIPAIGVFRMRALNEIGFWDPLFYTFDFIDDDFSLRARRHGFRQVLCDDVICYHRGSATVSTEQLADSTLENGRRIFREKNGVDAWENGACYDLNMLQSLRIPSNGDGCANILGIDCGFGDNVLQIGNMLRRVGTGSVSYCITTDKSYLPDLAMQSDAALHVPRRQLMDALKDCFSGVQFSYVCIGMDLTDYAEPYCLLELLSERMCTGGQLILQCKNPYFAVRLHQMLQLSIPEKAVLLLPPEQVVSEAKRWFSRVDLSGIVQPIQDLDDFIACHYGTQFVQSQHPTKLEICQYCIRCMK